MADGFDRVRVRSAQPVGPAAAGSQDSQGKRALFTAATEVARPGVGSVLVECSRCGEATVLGLGAALRTALPSLHLAVRLGHGDRVHSVSLGEREFPSYLKCPACGRPSWVRYTVQL